MPDARELLEEARNQLDTIGRMSPDHPLIGHEQGVSRGLAQTIDEFLKQKAPA